MSSYWFKPKTPGWGAGIPKNWQGWLATGILILCIFFVGFMNGIFSLTNQPRDDWRMILRFMFDSFVLGVIFSVLFQEKIEGGLKWRWKNENASKLK